MSRIRNAYLLSLSFALLCAVKLLHHIAIDYERRVPSQLSADALQDFSWEKLPPSRRLEWQDCYPDRQCARLVVPLNYCEPNGREAIIAVVRKPSKYEEGSPLYRGPVLFNPGGPGGSGVDMIRGGSGDSFSTILGPQFDIVGFDPRGISRSLPRASFFKTDVERALWGQTVGVVNTTEEGVARTWARFKVLGDLAAETDDGYLRHINTDNTARDMLSIVRAHGREKIQYWGFSGLLVSYGTVLGATFASMFPDNIERFVIDGVVDSENYYATLWSNNLLDTDKAFDTFLTGCAEAGPEGCKFWAPTPDDIRQNLTALFDSVRARPVPVRTKNNYGVLDYITLKFTVLAALYSPYANFQLLAQGLAELAAGNVADVYERATSPPFECSCGSSDEHQFENVRDGQTTISCNDGDDVPGELESAQEYFEMLTGKSNWGDVWARIRFACVGWPKFPKNHFQGPFEANTSHPILLIGNTADPVTPLWAAKKMARGFNNSVVLTQNSAGHCSISAPSPCTQSYIRQYFLDGTLPEQGTVCEPIGSPFDPKAESVLDRSDAVQQVLAGMTEEEKELYNAAYDLSVNPIVPVLL
ncbi:hypothetical protein CVT26_015976 [Gymnopilus dilepis]|uniref:Peptidase S33 tripeptidyl aminopeptidase-like C-terminal domain-containing protein n=1 Tax=Gymnopilus dilepis TaxID=231916 RepID=A0A409XYL9_9AGAR|nr:hypothetical protein CVT26_015976 [Gymnopilus dilepis]